MVETGQDVKPFRVLSLDGGGIRGLYTACVLKGVMERFKGDNGELDIGSGFDLIVGTSTGGIIACGLAFGLSIDRLIGLYKDHGPKIFDNPKPTEKFATYWWAWVGKNKPANKNDHLKKVLEELFGEATVGSLYESRKIGLCLTSVDLLAEESRVFKTGHDPKRRLDDPIKLVDICLATSAAPIYLPLVAFDNPLGNGYNVFADGGLWANNPVLVGLIESLALTEKNEPLQIISVGTRPEPGGAMVSKDKLNRGVFDWEFGTKALTLSMNAQAAGTNFMAGLLQGQLRKLGKDVSVIRFPQMTPSVDHMKYLGMDLASKDALEALMALAAKDAVEVYRWCQDQGNENGKIIDSIFRAMAPLSIAQGA